MENKKYIEKVAISLPRKWRRNIDNTDITTMEKMANVSLVD
jgi:hypothetical protein